MRVLAALSGGVDSAVAAARVVAAGYDVVGVHLALSENPARFRTGARGCCSREDARDAARVADTLGIPFYVWDLADRFRDDVVADFVAEYAAGRTPNPCLRCNEHIKFAAVLERALALGFDAVATGHYARAVAGPDGPELHRAVDTAKDQSYVLGVLTADQLGRALFPLGDTPKPDVREEAAARGLLVAEKADSHDICFIPDGDTAGFLRRQLGERPGVVVDTSGEVLGEHAGAYAFTVGQRRGLGLTRAPADGRRRYVLGIEPVSGAVTVGDRAALAVGALLGVDPRWCGSQPAGPFSCQVQVRAHGQAHPAWVEVQPGADRPGLRITLHEPVMGVAPGQAAVLYGGSRVLGSATVAETTPA